MEDKSDILLFRQINLLHGLSDAEVVLAFRRCAQAMTVPKGAVIFEEGSEGHQIHFLAQGQVRVEVATGNGSVSRPVAVVKAPDVFGEVAFLDGSPRSATTVALIDSRIYVMDGEKLSALMVEMPILGYRIMSNFARILAGKVRSSNRVLVGEARKLESVQATALPLAARRYHSVLNQFTTHIRV